MKYLMILFLGAIFSPGGYAQSFSFEYGKISADEYKMSRYDPDKLAEAVIIYDIGKSYFTQTDNGFDIIFERRTKIKILNKAGFKWAEIAIPFYEESRKLERVYDVDGTTYNYENGIVRKSNLDNRNIYEDKKTNNWREKKFAMPDVKEGSVIELKYKISSPYLFNFRSWEFQSKIPVVYSEYTTLMIPFYEYTYIFQGTSKFDQFENHVEEGVSEHFAGVEYRNMVYKFVMKNLPAFKDEEFITSINDYIIKIDFQLAKIKYPNGAVNEIITTWPELCKELLKDENFGGFLNSCKKKAKIIVDSLHLTMGQDSINAEIIFNYVKKNYTWNGDHTKFSNITAKKFLLNKSGNSAELNLFLASMLLNAGIKTYPVLISTRGNGKIWLDYPFLHYFNHVITASFIGNYYTLLDATEPLCNYGMIPDRDLNSKGLIIKKDIPEWIEMETFNVSEIADSLSIKLDLENDSINYSVSSLATSYDALSYRKKIQKDISSFKKEFYDANQGSLTNFQIINENDTYLPLRIKYKNNKPIEMLEENIVIAPFGNLVINENPLKQSYRNYPVDLIYSKQRLFVSTITIPQGFRLAQNDKILNIDDENIELKYKIEKQDESSIKVVGFYYFKKAKYGITDYFDLKGYFNKIVTTFNSKLILEKIK